VIFIEVAAAGADACGPIAVERQRRRSRETAGRRARHRNGKGTDVALGLANRNDDGVDPAPGPELPVPSTRTFQARPPLVVADTWIVISRNVNVLAADAIGAASRGKGLSTSTAVTASTAVSSHNSSLSQWPIAKVPRASARRESSATPSAASMRMIFRSISRPYAVETSAAIEPTLRTVCTMPLTTIVPTAAMAIGEMRRRSAVGFRVVPTARIPIHAAAASKCSTSAATPTASGALPAA
jgi:hypothetical protein